MINIDSMAVDKVITIGKISISVELSLVKSILQLMDMNWVVEMSHCYKEANCSATSEYGMSYRVFAGHI